MSDEQALNFEELVGELREFRTRVVALEVRDEQANLIVRAEGAFGHLEESPPGEWSFQLGGNAPPEREGLRFIAASWITVCIDARRVIEAHDIATGIGAPIVLRIRMVDGMTIQLWPAMPAREQWTDQHEDNR